MRLVAVTVWTSRRKWLGNVVPAIFWVPPATVGLFLVVVKGQFLGTGLWLLILSTVLGWLAVNQFGFFENARMRKQLTNILKATGQELPKEHYFVGFATPKYSSILDAHEDVGFLCIYSDRVSFISESRNLELSKSDLKLVRFRPNVHSLIFLGRWISLEGISGGRPIRLLIEPREKVTLFGNRRFGAKLQKHLAKWISPVK